MKQEQLSIAVIGAGVIGLTSAIRLLEQGHTVTLFARTIPPHTTSDVAAAYWAPHEYGNDRRRRWAYASLQEFRRLAANSTCGVTLLIFMTSVMKRMSNFSVLIMKRWKKYRWVVSQPPGKAYALPSHASMCRFTCPGFSRGFRGWVAG